MSELRVPLPLMLTLESVVEFSHALYRLPTAPHYRFVPDGLQHCPPFGMLLTAACIRQFTESVQTRDASVVVDIRVDELNAFASHMGFWQACGISKGKAPGEARGSDIYLPLTLLRRPELEDDPANRGYRLPQILNRESDRLTDILVQSDEGPLNSTLSYSLRELFRNAFEHAGVDGVWYAAQCWPSKNSGQGLVELAVLDEGVGIMNSLKTNPAYAQVPSVPQAILWAMKLGVTRAVEPSKLTFDNFLLGERSPTISMAVWDNAGWGLYVLTEVARAAGSIFIVSNGVGLFRERNRIHTFDVHFQGTAIRVLLNPVTLGDLLHRVLAKSAREDKPSRLTPSMIQRFGTSNYG